MKLILFDLGDTLATNGVLVPKAIETLQAVEVLEDAGWHPPVLSLISDFKDAASPQQIKAFRAEYLAILDGLGIRPFFEPVANRVTLSTEIGIRKPGEQLFRLALDKVNPKLQWKDAAFVTENIEHIAAARLLGMKGICVKGGPNPISWDVASLPEILPLLSAWIKS